MLNSRKFAAICFSMSLLLMLAALYNGFPLVDADSAIYIEQAIYPHFTPDRTPFYGLFIKICSLHTSLWFPIWVQSLLLSYLLCKYVISLLGFRSLDGNAVASLVLCFLTIISFTFASWVVSCLMADAFTPILTLAVLLIVSDKSKSQIQLAIYSAIAFLAISMHFSHILIVFLFAVVLFLHALYSKNKFLKQRCALLFTLCLVFWGVMGSANAMKHHGFVFARGFDKYMMGKLNETGILHHYLQENCGKKSFEICAYNSNLPSNLHEFLESGESPMHRMGGWDSGGKEYNAILKDVFTTPEYIGMFVRKSVVATLKQSTHTLPPEQYEAFGKNTEVYKKVQNYFPDESREYITSMQQANTLSTSAAGFLYMLVFIFSVIWLLVMYDRVMTKELLFVYKCLILFLIANAFVSGTFASVVNRFQYRLFWILPATNIAVIVGVYSRKYMPFFNSKTDRL